MPHAMRARRAAAALLLALVCGCASRESSLRRSLQARGGTVVLPDGAIELKKPLEIPAGARDLVIRGGADTVLRMALDFDGRALIAIRDAVNVRLTGFAIEGAADREALAIHLPPSDVAFADYHYDNAILLRDVEGAVIDNVRFRRIRAFPILAHGGKRIRVEKVLVEDSGSRDGNFRNNTTGGILFENGVDGFEVRGSRFLRVLGNGVWTHSRFHAPRCRNGVIAGNFFDTIARDAVQVGHATRVRVENNHGVRIGYPVGAVDVEGGGMPVGVDTAGNVDESVYTANRFEEINGKCVDLDGFHHGEVSANTCINRGPASDYPNGHFGIVFNNTNPEMESEAVRVYDNHIEGTLYGGIFLIGRRHHVRGNRLLRLNLSGCNESKEKFRCEYFEGEPDLLQSGIYLGRRAERPAVAAANLIEGNTIGGHKMKSRCIGYAPEAARAGNTVRNNTCLDEDAR